MKKPYKIWTLVIVLFLTLLPWYAGEKIAIKKFVNGKCSQYEIGEDWAGCVVDLSLERNDAKYCKSAGIFSPYSGLCMNLFAQRTQNKESCDTIFKPRYKEECLNKFKESNPTSANNK